MLLEEMADDIRTRLPRFDSVLPDTALFIAIRPIQRR
jgi:hypothetical protein